jgi:hypothetical protein
MSNVEASVVIATCNRIQPLTRLLRAMLAQDCDNFEVIVVDDCSQEDVRSHYAALWETLDGRFRLHLRSADDGHPRGPGASRNMGISLARGDVVAFCDDDDMWIRSDHLSFAARSMKTHGAELFIANMQTSDSGQIDNPDWYGKNRQVIESAEHLEPSLRKLSRAGAGQILRHQILHANTLVASKALLTRIGMYWEKIGFAEDHDLAFRIVDAARGILFRTEVTADLDVTTHLSVARRYQEDERLLFSILATLHAESQLQDAGLRKIVRGNRAWRLMELANLKRDCGDTASARGFALQALLLQPSISALRLVMKTGFAQHSGETRSA